MDNQTFIENCKITVDQCLQLLMRKSSQYSDNDDRLHNFKSAATLLHRNPLQACAGHLSKHTICLNDMIASGETFPLSMWEEEIHDAINYLLIMRNIINELGYEVVTPEPAEKFNVVQDAEAHRKGKK